MWKHILDEPVEIGCTGSHQGPVNFQFEYKTLRRNETPEVNVESDKYFHRYYRPVFTIGNRDRDIFPIEIDNNPVEDVIEMGREQVAFLKGSENRRTDKNHRRRKTHAKRRYHWERSGYLPCTATCSTGVEETQVNCIDRNGRQ